MTVRSRPSRVRTAAVAGGAVIGLTLAGCGSAGAGDDGAPSSGEALEVVASTSVWGTVAQAVGGEDVEVTPVVDDPGADPHSYESTPRDAAEVGKADLVVFNGGGYDEFMQQILSSTAQTTPKVQAFQGENTHSHSDGGSEHQHEGHAHEGKEPKQHGGGGHSHEHGNEHIWYDLDAVQDVSQSIADELGALRPEQQQEFTDRASAFADQVTGLQQRVDDIAARHGGTKVVVTEPIAHYLVERGRLDDITPQEFVDSVETGGDPSVAAVAEIRKSIDSGQAGALIYNPQTESPVTEQLRAQAEQRGLPVVELTELPPESTDYVAWMDSQIAALDAALNGQR
ncbi:ABC transporter [Allosaccharopolyspora coralli]|uniref:ABC transporter n=1 Tax=Allosaccharopolyspora coralli TaxID=2665642 RepID=A0A5Q3Q1Q1_9PSEU|nr:zinc ABC transporter substrate-binding protein [Allosaccharopolyspora coralli]QGK68461.1 ABC transporter [Allosaccharopolyspora coralli]